MAPNLPQELLGGTLCKHGPSSWQGCLGCRPLFTGLSPAPDLRALPPSPLSLARPGTSGQGGAGGEWRVSWVLHWPLSPAEQPSSAWGSPKPQVAWESSLLPKEPSRLRLGVGAPKAKAGPGDTTLTMAQVTLTLKPVSTSSSLLLGLQLP